MIQLSVNINKIATLRNSRGGDIPNLIYYTKLVVGAGANGITVHPRIDERHITRKDVYQVKEFLDQYNYQNNSKVEYNIEGEPSERYIELVKSIVPEQATLVPVRPGEITSDHGFDLEKDCKKLEPIINQLKKKKIRISLFVEAGVKNLQLAKEIGADRIELYTGPFAYEFEKSEDAGKKSFELYNQTAIEAESYKLGVNAGHDLDHHNLKIFRTLKGLLEVSIGHRLVSYALEVGIQNSVKAYLQTLSAEF